MPSVAVNLIADFQFTEIDSRREIIGIPYQRMFTGFQGFIDQRSCSLTEDIMDFEYCMSGMVELYFNGC